MKQTNKETNRQPNKQTNKQANKQPTNQPTNQTNKQTNKQANKPTHKQTNYPYSCVGGDAFLEHPKRRSPIIAKGLSSLWGTPIIYNMYAHIILT